MEMDTSLNVYGEQLESCGSDPKTGFFRDGCCNTNALDAGSHTICAQMSQEFLEYSRDQGNDLITPVPHFGFPGLKPGDRWCLCASRWLQAHKVGKAPRVYLRCTHQRALEIVPLELLREAALDVS